MKICEITIPEYPTHIPLTKSRRPKYYPEKEHIPKKYQTSRYTFKKYNKQLYLFDKVEKRRVIKNKKNKDKPRYLKLSGNDIISGYASPHIRAKIARELKNFYRPYIQDFVKTNGQITTFPLQIEWDLYTTVDRSNFDLDNLFFYYKYFEDTLFESESKDESELSREGEDIIPLIPDDNIQYVTKPGSAPKLIPINNWNDRKFVFKFYHDRRKILQQYELWND